MRLVGGGFANEGTVEVCMDHMWGLVSDAGWNASHAKVVCRQLGFTSGSKEKETCIYSIFVIIIVIIVIIVVVSFSSISTFQWFSFWQAQQ